MDDVERSGGRPVVGRAGSGCQAGQGQPNEKFELGDRSRKRLECVPRAVCRSGNVRWIRRRER